MFRCSTQCQHRTRANFLLDSHNGSHCCQALHLLDTVAKKKRFSRRLTETGDVNAWNELVDIVESTLVVYEGAASDHAHAVASDLDFEDYPAVRYSPNICACGQRQISQLRAAFRFNDLLRACWGSTEVEI